MIIRKPAKRLNEPQAEEGTEHRDIKKIEESTRVCVYDHLFEEKSEWTVAQNLNGLLLRILYTMSEAAK